MTIKYKVVYIENGAMKEQKFSNLECATEMAVRVNGLILNNK